METENINFVASVREIVSKYNQDEIERCINCQINTDSNACLPGKNNDEIVNILSKAGFISHLMVGGYSINDALRELGKRMRVLTQ